MVQYKKFGAGMALVAGLIGMGASGAAWALPEMEVGSHLVGSNAITQAPSVAPDGATVAQDGDSVAADDGAQSASN